MADIADGATLLPSGVLHTRLEYVTEELIEKYCEALDEARSNGRGMPLGIAFVLALRTLMDWHGLPDGGIMLGHEANWIASVSVPCCLRTTLAIAASRVSSNGLIIVDLGYETRMSTGELVLTQTQKVLWPR